MLFYGEREMEMKEKLNEVIEYFKKIEKKLNGDIEYLFKELIEITNDCKVRSVFFVDNDNVKYITNEPKGDGFRNLLIINNKIYSWSNYEIKDKNIMLQYDNEYNLPNELLEILRKLPESDIIYLRDYYLRFYCLLKNHYPINFVRD